MKLHLDLQLPVSPYSIDHQDKILMVGSCFTEHIFTKLHQLKFNAHSNPFGIVFNPQSIYQQLKRIVHAQEFGHDDDFVFGQQLWHAWEAHGSLSRENKRELIQELNHTLHQWKQHLNHAKCLIITLGSAFAYQHQSSHQWVANCHKIPQKEFEKHLIPQSDIVEKFSEVFDLIRLQNPNIKMILTVSPVRHLRDGVVENNLSKSILIQAIHELVSKFEGTVYFPAYELVIDDLRDYRFFEVDMMHPNQQAIDYVWRKFSSVYFNAKTQHLNSKIEDIFKAFSHRPIQAAKNELVQFKKNYFKKCESLQEEFPFIDLNAEMRHFSSL